MPNARGQGQKLIPVPADEKFIADLNTGFRRAGYSNRSQFIRDAIVEKLGRMGINIAKKYSVAPDRGGKTARQRPPAPSKTVQLKKGPAHKVRKSVKRNRSK